MNHFEICLWGIVGNKFDILQAVGRSKLPLPQDFALGVASP
jgi:hypothetical protein